MVQPRFDDIHLSKPSQQNANIPWNLSLPPKWKCETAQVSHFQMPHIVFRERIQMANNCNSNLIVSCQRFDRFGIQLILQMTSKACVVTTMWIAGYTTRFAVISLLSSPYRCSSLFFGFAKFSSHSDICVLRPLSCHIIVDLHIILVMHEQYLICVICCIYFDYFLHSFLFKCTQTSHVCTIRTAAKRKHCHGRKTLCKPPNNNISHLVWNL